MFGLGVLGQFVVDLSHVVEECQNEVVCFKGGPVLDEGVTHFVQLEGLGEERRHPKVHAAPMMHQGQVEHNDGRFAVTILIGRHGRATLPRQQQGMAVNERTRVVTT